jgi:hypothetical protein
MRVKSQGLSPGVQDGQRANARTEALGIGGDDQQGLASGGEQDVVELPRIGQRNRESGVGVSFFSADT